MNKTILIGRVTKNIELRNSNGTSIASFTLAVNRNFKNSQGEYESDFINCVAFNQRADTLARYVLKGDRLGVEGRIQTRTYKDKDDKNVYVTEVIVENLEFLQPKTTKQEEVSVEVPVETTEQKDPFEEFGNEIDMENLDLPF